jgi:hypothetical protein
MSYAGWSPTIHPPAKVAPVRAAAILKIVGSGLRTPTCSEMQQ